jgi:mono/diheme cytochrome c family protein
VIALIVVVLAFVLLGLAVVGLAMRSGRRTTGKLSRGGQRAALIATGLVTLAFGIGVPVLAMAYNGSTESKQAPGGLELSASQQHGRQVFQKNCSTCHTLAAANAVGKVGPILDDIIPPIAVKKDRVAFIENAITNGFARGNGQMPKGVVDGTDESDVADFVATAAGR